MRESFFTRGSSLVGAVLVVALLSAVAIGVDSQLINKSSISQTAAVTSAEKKDSSLSTASKPTPAAERACEIGNDYVVVTDKGTPTVYSTLLTTSNKLIRLRATHADASGRYQCKGAAEGATLRDGRICSASGWNCKVYHCISAQTPPSTKDTWYPLHETVKGSDGTLLPEADSVKGVFCRFIGRSAPGTTLKGDSIQARNVPEVISSVLKNEEATEKEKKEVIENLTSLDESTRKSLDSVFSNEKESIQVKLAENQEAQEHLAERLKEFACSQDPCTDDTDYKLTFAEIGKKEEEAYKLREQLSFFNQAETAALKPSATPDGAKKAPPDGPPDEKRPPGGPTLVYVERAPAKDCGPWDFVCRNTNQPDEHREKLYIDCQAGNSRACQEYLGRAPAGSAYSGYGGAHSSGGQPCGAQQQQSGILGIITTITSLFGKGNSASNCGNGNGSDAPLPTCRITASPTTIPTGGKPVTLTWQSEKAFSATLSNSGNVSTQGSMTVNPQTTTTYTLSLGGFQDNRTGQQLRGQCAVQVVVGTQGGGTGDGAVKAEISCRPQVADVGMSVAVSFACRNANTSVGNGFSTANQMSGSATPIVAQPTIGSDSVTYGLTCSKEGKTDTAQCTVKINKSTIVLIANPKIVESGKESNIGWITSGMESCTISSPTLSGFTAENAGSTSVSGVAKTPALTADAKFVLSCTTKAGGTKTTETTVKVGN